MAQRAINAVLSNNQCAYFEAQRDYEKSMAKRYDQLLFALAVAVVAALISLILSFNVDEDGLKIATGIATVVTGGAAGWVIARGKSHRDEAKEYEKAITEHCQS